MTHDVCERCERQNETVKRTQISPGRDYAGVGGAPAPPEHAMLCGQCRDELFPEPEVDDVDCMECGDLIPNHRLDDPPVCDDCRSERN